MGLDLVPLWAGVLALGVFMYVLLDGFDLGVGILFAFAPDDASRDMMMNSVAPIWDGNETWLVLGGVALLAAFPLAFAIIFPAVYFPILFMLIGLIFRGVAFEFRHLTRRRYWDHAFHWGSVVATFARGVVLGTYVQGIPIAGRQYAGGSFDWATPFALLTGAGLIVGYGLIGACWLVMKTEGELAAWARRKAVLLTFGVAAFIAMVSIWTPFIQPQIYRRWFAWPNLLLLSPVPVITLGLFAWLLHSLRSKARGLAISRRAGTVRDVLSRTRHQHRADDRPLYYYALGRGVGFEIASVHDHRHAVSAADHRHVHGLVVLGVPGQGEGGKRLSLTGP